MNIKKGTISSEVLFDEVNDRKHRYYLYREWQDKGNIACVIMLNPSYADEVKWDYSSMRVMNYLIDYKLKKYKAIYIVNLFSVVETNSKNLFKIIPSDRNNSNTDYWIDNSIQKSDDIFIGWGAVKNKNMQARIDFVKSAIKKHNKSIYRFTNPDGSSSHVSRLTNKAKAKKITLSDL